MNYDAEPECTKEFLQRIVDEYHEHPDESLTEVRRFAAQHDTVELLTQRKVIIQCHVGRCSATLALLENGHLAVTSPQCPR